MQALEIKRRCFLAVCYLCQRIWKRIWKSKGWVNKRQPGSQALPARWAWDRGSSDEGHGVDKAREIKGVEGGGGEYDSGAVGGEEGVRELEVKQ